MEQLGGYRKKIFKKEHCSPANKANTSCLNNKLIKKIAKIINKFIIHKSKEFKINLSMPISEIHEEICKILHEITGCSSESCWIKINKIIKNLNHTDRIEFKKSFKPIMPKKWVDDYNTWLNTNDIENCLNQYEDKYSNFYFYGAIPIDFHKCKVSDLCSFSVKKHINMGHDNIGIVFNTDPHYKSGEHWISMFIDLTGNNNNKTPGIYYFDSYGNKAPENIKNFVHKIKKQGKKLGKEFLFLYNDYAHQKGDSQCGMFCIHFIHEMLRLRNFKKFLNSNLTDKKMIQFRKKYFIPPSELKCKYNL
tara:strand:- start:289 stop:1206 length:918 start_codon:yes stop_codon:yes gene_type:complete